MSANLTLGIRLTPYSFERIKIENIDLLSNVDVIKSEAAKMVNVDKNTIQLIYRGMILPESNTLSACGVKSGVMIHVLPKKEPPKVEPPIPLSENKIQKLMATFRTITSGTGYRTALHRLSRPEVIERILQLTPSLSTDPTAVVLLRNPELLLKLSNMEAVRKVAMAHPAIVDAAEHITAVLKETSMTTATDVAGPSTGYSYSLEALSDDDEDMDRFETIPVQGITPAQLAAALESAGSQSAQGRNLQIVTREMLSNAMQSAIGQVNSPMQMDALDDISTRLAPQIRQMHEMGLTDDVVNIQALQVTNGDVQAAIDLVFSESLSN